MTCWQNAIPIQKNDFWPQKSKFSSLAANWSLPSKFFQHGRGVSLVPLYEGTKGFTPPPQKMDFWPKTGQIWPKTGIFGQILAFLAHSNAQLVAWLLVVARRLYPARHPFTLWLLKWKINLPIPGKLHDCTHLVWEVIETDVMRNVGDERVTM